MTETKINIQGNKGTITLFYDAENAGHIEFNIDAEGNIDIDHTEVDPKFGGKGLGKVLVMAAVEYAKENDISIKTTCPFAHKVFDRTPEIQSFWKN
ncbi:MULTISPECIES: GNAT family N-acetyltransferase [Amniculibacterium]|jgi:predicted GNAT family acetyltransferase|uniref:GNAT family N-acetyltransferase n=1 Tax=Amniculibacterium TaxID=2715289 RepID=UPI000F597D86|nr:MULTISPECIES: GNAT family N-acetyltransferase [Amniculibacterium]